MNEDITTQIKTDQEIVQKLKSRGIRNIPRLVRGSIANKRAGRSIEITQHIFQAFGLRYCPDCNEGEKFLIFKFVAVCMTCNEFYYIIRG